MFSFNEIMNKKIKAKSFSDVDSKVIGMTVKIKIIDCSVKTV